MAPAIDARSYPHVRHSRALSRRSMTNEPCDQAAMPTARITSGQSGMTTVFQFQRPLAVEMSAAQKGRHAIAQ